MTATDFLQCMMKSSKKRHSADLLGLPDWKLMKRKKKRFFCFQMYICIPPRSRATIARVAVSPPLERASVQPALPAPRVPTCSHAKLAPIARRAHRQSRSFHVPRAASAARRASALHRAPALEASTARSARRRPRSLPAPPVTFLLHRPVSPRPARLRPFAPALV